MRYRLAVLGLAAVLGLLPGLMTTTPAAPAPDRDRAKPPAIYALVYVGLGKHHPDNAKRIKTALQELRGLAARAAVRDPKMQAVPIVREHDPIGKTRTIIKGGKEQMETYIERDEWVESKARAANLDGTAVVRVWFTDGSPQEQVLIVNAIARGYIKYHEEIGRGALEQLEKFKANFKARQEAAGARVTEADEKEFQRQELWIKNPPHVIEWAEPPEKP